MARLKHFFLPYYKNVILFGACIHKTTLQTTIMNQLTASQNDVSKDDNDLHDCALENCLRLLTYKRLGNAIVNGVQLPFFLIVKCIISA